LAPQLLAAVAIEGTDQAVSNLLVGLGRMCSGPSPLISTAAAQGYAGQLLSGVQLKSVSSWSTQSITNALWALGELQLEDNRFIHSAAAAARNWLPLSKPREVSQAATACAQLQYKDEHFMGLLLQRVQQLLQPNRGSRTRPLSPADKDSLAALSCVSVAQLDMRVLAGAVRNIVASSGIGQRDRTHPSNLRRLWLFHSWLLEHQLLDGKGLAGLVEEQQLQQGEKDAAKWGDKTRL
jgi:hypothetical protein